MPRAEQLSDVDAIQRALELREAGGAVMTYPTIAFLMSEYHGVHYSWSWWRMKMRAAGAEGRRPAREGVRLVRARAAALEARTTQRVAEVDGDA